MDMQAGSSTKREIVRNQWIDVDSNEERASFIYSQDNLLPPVQHMTATFAPSNRPAKKKKLVRRVKQ